MENVKINHSRVIIKETKVCVCVCGGGGLVSFFFGASTCDDVQVDQY